ncbi:MAG TPA: 3-deoxy-7-phosphoheptulonate synthase [Candidatus Avidehalobacter gallistercoris]|uniref:3-deoxy-7-phosphoheptulonate synthase n=1 Tax=Candidatus Avidehalobacter gallistercoris TaxID=2840694 RepID=A0A9D1KYM8_9FIRM|nr:3-deoxy-7-phosphoheptulonate synthase [Candidatus Avidehalobacter gallistercoris]
MIITLKRDASQEETERLIHSIEQLGLEMHLISGTSFNVFGVVGDTTILDEKKIYGYSCVQDVCRIAAPYKLANRVFHPSDSVIDVGGVKVGGHEKIVVISGPCSVEDEESLMTSAEAVKKAGADMLRGGAYKPRTSPYAFQGRGEEGLITLQHAKEKFGFPIVTELMSINKIQEFLDHDVDMIQIGARNMQNFDLLKEVGKTNVPVLLKRGLSNTIEEWLMAAEYIMSGGNTNVILCERGIRTFEKYTRNTLDLSVIPIVKERSHLPIVIDPSHATGDRDLVESMSLAAIAAGADGLIIEAHHNPEAAWSDGAQTVTPEQLQQIIAKGKAIAHVIGRSM